MVAPPRVGDPSAEIFVTVFVLGLQLRFNGPFVDLVKECSPDEGMLTCFESTQDCSGTDEKVAHNIIVKGFN